MTIGKSLKNRRKTKNWTQHKLAAETGYTRNSIINWENDIRVPRVDVFIRLAKALGISAADIIRNIENQNKAGTDKTNSAVKLQKEKSTQPDEKKLSGRRKWLGNVKRT